MAYINDNRWTLALENTQAFVPFWNWGTVATVAIEPTETCFFLNALKTSN